MTANTLSACNRYGGYHGSEEKHEDAEQTFGYQQFQGSDGWGVVGPVFRTAAVFPQ